MRALFRVSRLGTIAGCMVTSGVVRRGAQVRVVRDGTVVYETTIAQLKRFKDDAREVSEGFECGILLDGFNDVKEGDVLEAYETREVERTDLDQAPVAAPRRCSRRRVARRRTPWRRLRRHPHRRAPLPGVGLAQGEAEAREVREGAAARALRRLRRRGRPPRPLAALDASRSRARRASTRELQALLDAAERYLGSQEWELLRVGPGGGRPWRALSGGGRSNEAMRKVLSEALPTLKDPRIGFVTVTGVRTTTDLSPGDRLRQRARQRARSRQRTLDGLRVSARRAPGAGRTRARHPADSGPDLRIRSRDRAGRAAHEDHRRARAPTTDDDPG